MLKVDFNHLVRQHNRSLYGIAFRILRSQEEAEDAVQDVFIKLWNMGSKLEEYNNPGALAVTMIKNLCIDQLRKKKHFVRDETGKYEFNAIDDDSPFELLQRIESGNILKNIIDHLPEIYSSVIRLRETEGLSFEEIAQKTDQNINTIRVTLSRARKMIRDEYNKYQYERRGIKEVGRKVL
jgi:RNA polymerase sigma-70 factor (ECF subfamily)